MSTIRRSSNHRTHHPHYSDATFNSRAHSNGADGAFFDELLLNRRQWSPSDRHYQQQQRRRASHESTHRDSSSSRPPPSTHRDPTFSSAAHHADDETMAAASAARERSELSKGSWRSKAGGDGRRDASSGRSACVSTTERLQGFFDASRSCAAFFPRASRFALTEKSEHLRRTAAPGPGAYNSDAVLSTFTPRPTPHGGSFGRSARPELWARKEAVTRARAPSWGREGRGGEWVGPDTPYVRDAVRPAIRGGVVSRTGRPELFKQARGATPGPGQYVPLYGAVL